jgi:NAD dependent epimerase/dehydratase family enzyme
MGRALLLDSARVVPRRLERAGFRFRHPGLEDALRAALAREVEGASA